MPARVLVLAAVASIALGASPAPAAEQKSPIWGGGGGTHGYNLDCGSTGVMVGVTVKWGQWIDQLGLICRTVKADGTLGSFYTRGPVGGQGGNQSGPSQCREGFVVVSVAGQSGSFVDSFHGHCKRWDAAGRKPTGETVWDVKVANHKPLSGYNRFPCLGTAVGKALRGKYGWYIDSLQFVCDQYNQ